MNLTEEEKLAIQEALMSLFSSGGTDESELIQVLERKTLNLTGEQIKALLYLKSLNNRFVNDLINHYLYLKQFNNAYRIILKGIELLSLYNFIKGRLRINVNLSK